MPELLTCDRVLVVTYLFPPAGGVGVPRFVSYAQYLPQQGCEVYILTVRNPATPAYDPELAKQVPPQTRVFRAFNPALPYAWRDRLWKHLLSAGGSKGSGRKPPSGGVRSLAKRAIQRLFCPDVQVVWTPFAIHTARRIIAKHAITTVLVNLPPYSCLYIANDIKRRFPNVKLILDFRDEWIDNYLAVFDSAASNYKLRLAHKLEREAVSRADYVTAVTRSQLKQIHDRYPEQPQAKFVYAPNGYDPVLYSRFSRRKKASGKMVVSYFGTVYANETYDPILNYLDVVDELPALVRDAIETRFIGRVAREAASFLEGRKSAVRRLGFMPKHEAIGYLAESDYNLVVSGNPTTHAGKLFDYLAMGTPILALCPVDGEMAQVLRETRAGWCVNPRDRAAIRDLLLAAYERTQNDVPSEEPDWEAIRFYEWPSLVARLAKMVGMGSEQRV